MLEKHHWHKALKRITQCFGDLDQVSLWREDKDEERDLVYENAILFIQTRLVFRDFSMAIKSGNSGRVKNCIKFFMVWFQGTIIIIILA